MQLDDDDVDGDPLSAAASRLDSFTVVFRKKKFPSLPARDSSIRSCCLVSNCRSSKFRDRFFKLPPPERERQIRSSFEGTKDLISRSENRDASRTQISFLSRARESAPFRAGLNSKRNGANTHTTGARAVVFILFNRTIFAPVGFACLVSYRAKCSALQHVTGNVGVSFSPSLSRSPSLAFFTSRRAMLVHR